MKTAGRENPNRWAVKLSNRAHGAEGQNRSCSFTWAVKQDIIRPLELCFFLTSSFRELTRRLLLLPVSPSSAQNRTLNRVFKFPGTDSWLVHRTGWFYGAGAFPMRY